MSDTEQRKASEVTVDDVFQVRFAWRRRWWHRTGNGGSTPLVNSSEARGAPVTVLTYGLREEESSIGPVTGSVPQIYMSVSMEWSLLAFPFKPSNTSRCCGLGADRERIMGQAHNLSTENKINNCRSD